MPRSVRTFKPFVLAAAMRDGVRNPELGADQDVSERKILDPDKSLYNGKDDLTIRRYDGTVWEDEKGDEWRQSNDEDASY
ncbi:penicillin-binding protein [Streptomyces tanashiensis]